MSAQLDEILDNESTVNDESSDSKSGSSLDDSQIFQSMGLLGLFRRKPFSNPSVSACQLVLFVYQMQSQGLNCCFQDIKECLGIKEEEFITGMRELGCEFSKAWGGYQIAGSGEIEPVFETNLLKSKKIDEWSFALSDQCFKKISEIKGYSIYKKN